MAPRRRSYPTWEANISRFFFHLRSGPGEVSEDEEGVELANLEGAYLLAFRTAYDMSGEFLRRGVSPTSFSFDIADRSGTVLLELPFWKALGGKTGRSPHPLRRIAKETHERAATTVRLCLQVGEEIRAAQEQIRRSRELLRSSNRSGATSPEEEADRR
jgi:hypothetical protein